MIKKIIILLMVLLIPVAFATDAVPSGCYPVTEVFNPGDDYPYCDGYFAVHMGDYREDIYVYIPSEKVDDVTYVCAHSSEVGQIALFSSEEENLQPTHLSFEEGIEFNEVYLEFVINDKLVWHRNGTMVIENGVVVEPGMFFFINLEEKLSLRNFFYSYADGILELENGNTEFFLNHTWRGVSNFEGLEPVQLFTFEQISQYLETQSHLLILTSIGNNEFSNPLIENIHAPDSYGATYEHTATYGNTHVKITEFYSGVPGALLQRFVDFQGVQSVQMPYGVVYRHPALGIFWFTENYTVEISGEMHIDVIEAFMEKHPSTVSPVVHRDTPLILYNILGHMIQNPQIMNIYGPDSYGATYEHTATYGNTHVTITEYYSGNANGVNLLTRFLDYQYNFNEKINPAMFFGDNIVYTLSNTSIFWFTENYSFEIFKPFDEEVVLYYLEQFPSNRVNPCTQISIFNGTACLNYSDFGFVSTPNLQVTNIRIVDENIITTYGTVEVILSTNQSLVELVTSFEIEFFNGIGVYTNNSQYFILDGNRVFIIPSGNNELLLSYITVYPTGLTQPAPSPNPQPIVTGGGGGGGATVIFTPIQTIVEPEIVEFTPIDVADNDSLFVRIDDNETISLNETDVSIINQTQFADNDTEQVTQPTEGGLLGGFITGVIGEGPGARILLIVLALLLILGLVLFVLSRKN